MGHGYKHWRDTLANLLSNRSVREIQIASDNNQIYSGDKAKIVAKSDQDSVIRDANKLLSINLDATVGSPTDGMILVYRSGGTDWVLEAKPAEAGIPTGDMSKATYDPTSVNGDAFNMDNMANMSAGKTTPINADNLTLWDSVASAFKKVTWTNIKATLKTYFDTLYNLYTLENHAANHTDGTDDIQNATSVQKGLATSTQITKLDGIATGADVTGDNAPQSHATSHSDGTDDVLLDGTQTEIAELGTATYDDLQDWINNTQSSGKIEGGGFTSNGDGTVSVAAGKGFIRATNSDIAEALNFDFPINATLALTDNSTNYIYVDYNSGTQLIKATVTKTTADNRTKILLGKIYRESTTLHSVEAGMVITELAKRVLTYLNALNGEIVRFTGLVTTETGNLNIAITAGTGSGGLTPISWSAVDTSGADTFRYWFNNGTWQSSDVSVINATQYNNYGVGLADLTNNNHYGCHFVYLHFEGDAHIVYGIDTYSTLAEAELAPTPANLPNMVSDFSLYIGKIIIKKTETSSFTDVRYPWTDATTTGLTGDHGALSGLADDDHPQYVQKTDYNATTFMYATLDDTPEPKTPTETRSILNVADGADVTGDNAPQAHDLDSHNSCTLAELSTDISDNTLIGTNDARLSDARTPTSHKDSHDPNDGGDPLDTAAPSELAEVQAAAVGTSHSLARADHGHQIQHSIVDNHIVTMDSADAASGETVRMTANGLESRSNAEMKTQLGYLTDLVDDTTPEVGGEFSFGAHSAGFTAQTATGDGTTTIDWKLGNKFHFTHGAMGETFTLIAPTKPGNLLLKIKQDATGGRDCTLPATVKWLGTASTFTDGGVSKTMILSMYWDGTNYWTQGSPWES